ncbi:hypothetical protein BA893_08165 [Vibrio natriegens]|nr:hypothetical protein BA893_08165 [Vibrio natriegens]
MNKQDAEPTRMVLNKTKESSLELNRRIRFKVNDRFSKIGRCGDVEVLGRTRQWIKPVKEENAKYGVIELTSALLIF